ncbi:MAG: hypothetical protein P9M14_12730 [Candidatus Alcyoniella australis]|nr:hypothetical protein [Candidatus Alcyoniella australis]
MAAQRIPADLKPDIRQILVCPKCHGELVDHFEPEGFICEACSKIYLVQEGIANFLIDEAQPWPPEK